MGVEPDIFFDTKIPVWGSSSPEIIVVEPENIATMNFSNFFFF